MDVAYCSQRGIGGYRGLFAQGEQIIPVFVTEDRSAWRLEELASALCELLSKITMESAPYAVLPDTFDMPSAPTKMATLRVVRKEPTQFRFIED
jgi:predicted GTPase